MKEKIIGIIIVTTYFVFWALVTYGAFNAITFLHKELTTEYYYVQTKACSYVVHAPNPLLAVGFVREQPGCNGAYDTLQEIKEI